MSRTSPQSLLSSSNLKLPQRIALCLGSHRSGTSIVSAALQAIGAELSLPRDESSEENPKGFFEHSDVITLNDELLYLAGSAWDDSIFDAAQLAELPADTIQLLQSRTRSIIGTHWRLSNLAAVKDPRMCRLLPFWLSALQAEGYADADVRCVLVTRSPVEAAISQRTRCFKNPDYYEFGQELAEGIALWISHLRQALRDCGNRKVLVLSYEDFLSRPRQLMSQLACFLDLTLEPSVTNRFITEFIDKSLWRSHANQAAVMETEVIFPGLLEAERLLAGFSGHIVSAEALAPVLERLDCPEFTAATRDVVSRAYGRLAGRRREERLTALATENALDVTLEARDELARERDKRARSAAEVEQTLRDRIGELEAGVVDRDNQLGQTQERYAALISEARKIEGNLRDRIRALEIGIADRDARLEILRSEQNLAIRQLADSFEANRQCLDESREALQRSKADLAEMAVSLQQLEAERDTLQEQSRGLRDSLSLAEAARDDLAAQNKDLHRVSDYLQKANEALLGSHSWRFTQPLRLAGTGFRRAGQLPKTSLRALNRASQVSHQRLKRSHPRTAEILRRSLQPLITRANLKLLGQHSVLPTPARTAASQLGLGTDHFSFDYQRPRAYTSFRPLVSVIVPNYNHAPYLAQRLESIFAQTYDNYEVLLLDDFSSDDSRKVLEHFAARYPDRTRTLFNETNSGGVFHQWEKGLAAARGDLIWIAESDDWASTNFLETLVPFFQNEAVQLAYARTMFMDAAGENQIWSMEEYLDQFVPERWSRSWVETGANIVRDAFSMTNIVPNASSAMFRRFERLDVLEIDLWRGMRTCGDWMFYLNAIRGGMMAYSPDAQNFYRIHDKNTSVTSHKGDLFYREHEEVAKCLRRHYRLAADNLDRMEANLRHQWRITRDDYSTKAFAECFDRSRIDAASHRKPALLMAGYGFCAGGGETFPIQLANEMKAGGHDVTFLDCAQEERVDGVRDMLATDIPVVSDFADLRRIVENFDIDLVHSHHGWVDNTVLDLLPADASCRTVVTLHGFYETVPKQQLKLLLPRLIERSGGLVYTADKNLDAIRQAGLEEKRPLHRIDNALAKSRITPLDRAQLGIDADAFLLTLVSRALHSKGWSEAIAAVNRAREMSGRDIHLILIGEGEAKDAAVAAGVPNHVHLEGFRENIRDYFAASDLGFLPSRFPGESFPLVIIDSLNAGTPVLASDIGEIRYMLTTDEGPAGALFALDDDWQIDIELLAAQITSLAEDELEMVRLKARVPLAAGRFDPRKMAEKYAAVYDVAAGRKDEP